MTGVVIHVRRGRWRGISRRIAASRLKDRGSGKTKGTGGGRPVQGAALHQRGKKPGAWSEVMV